MNKKTQQTWISAVIYIALGMVVLSIVLAAGMPVVNKLKDKTTVAQTKNIMHAIDKTIREIYNEGPGAQRTRTIEVGKGDFKIDENSEFISWVLDSKYVESSPGLTIKEGNLNINTEEPIVVGDYVLTLTLNYGDFLDLSLTDVSGIFRGRTTLTFRNAGPSAEEVGKIKIIITEI